ncbi:MAG: hypothetical protein FJ135_01865 [Deltaproteobacteria bacterium]|nr:hypothetical protein [Deltaproteobacteria bacterium]
MYEQIFESALSARGSEASPDWRYLFYLRSWDAFLALSALKYARVFRDGTAITFGDRSGSYEALGRVNGAFAYWSPWTRKVYSAFDINGLPNPNEVLNPAWDIEYAFAPNSGAGTFIDDIRKLYFHQPNSNRLDILDLDTGKKVDEIVHNAGERFAAIAWVQQGQVAGLCRASGKMRIMTYLGENRVIETGRISPFKVAAYDCEYHLFFTIGTDYKTRIFCREAWPAALSVPVFEPAQVYGFNANEVKTRLTGQDGEPCPGWWVHWALEGIGGGLPIGSLDKAVSETDKDGWAENYYYAPDSGQTGQTKIKTSVVLY